MIFAKESAERMSFFVVMEMRSEWATNSDAIADKMPGMHWKMSERNTAEELGRDRIALLRGPRCTRHRIRMGTTRVTSQSGKYRLLHTLARQEVLELDRPVLGPQAAGRAEVRDAALGRDAGAGERHHGAGAIDQVV